ncbi:MAG: hypothetical protein GXW99_03160 [Clostridiales bacterium]|nr:hypothetical protein [Clostridiales bacterium]
MTDKQIAHVEEQLIKFIDQVIEKRNATTAEVEALPAVAHALADITAESNCAAQGSPADAGLATSVQSDAAPACSDLPAFDYSGLTDRTVATLHSAENMIRTAHRDYVIKVADAVGMAHDELSSSENRTTSHSNQYTEDTFMGCDGWEISAHANSAPDHEPIQGKQYSDADYIALNNSLVRRIGTLNCGHAAFPIMLGVSSPQYTPEELQKFRDDNAAGIDYQGKHYTGYEATQLQRRIEESMRRQKRRILVDETTGDKEKLQTDQIRYVRLKDEYARFSKAAGLRTQVERAEVSGFGPKQGRAAAAENKAVEKLANSMYSGDTESNVSEYIHDRNAYISKYPTSDSRYFNAYKELKNIGIKKGVLLPAVQKQAFILPSGKRDPNHILKRMLERNITDDEVRSYMENARVMFAQWGGARQAFYGTDGVSVIAKDDGNWLYKTVWKKEDFDEETDLILEVLSKYGL